MPFRQIRIVPGMVGVRQMPEEMLGLIRFSDHFTEEVCRVFASQEVEDFSFNSNPDTVPRSPRRYLPEAGGPEYWGSRDSFQTLSESPRRARWS